jgi:hypothetical protein
MENSTSKGDGNWVWVFCGDDSTAVSGAFTSREKAEAWIAEHHLDGTLTRLPLDCGIYEWTIENGFFNPAQDYQRSSKFVSRFSSAYLEHYHFENGVNCNG